MRQADKILDYLRRHGEITQRDAISFGCYRLGARVFDLKDEGVAITTEIRKVKNADGSFSHIAVYHLA